MLNGKFFTGLPANMLDRSKGLNRQQTNFFWPDDSQNVSAVDSRIKRRTSIQADSREAYTPVRGDPSNSDAENKERFKKEFTRSSIQFYDTDEQTPLRRNRKKLTAPPQQKPQNVEPPVDLMGRRKEALSSKIEFFDYAEDLNNVPKTDKNNKADMERNTKNSPKLQNKNLSFDPPTDEAINLIENDVRNMRIAPPPRRRNPVRDSRSRYGRMPMNAQPHYSDFSEDYLPPRSRPIPPPARNRYPESDPDFDEYIPRRAAMAVSPPSVRPPYYARQPLDYIDGHPSPRQYYDEEIPSRKLGRQVQYRDSSNEHSNYDAVEQPTQQQRAIRKANILKVDNDIRNNEQRQMMPTATSSSPPISPPSQQHLRSNICFSDTESAAPCPPPPRRNIRSSAVNRVSVGLPD